MPQREQPFLCISFLFFHMVALQKYVHACKSTYIKYKISHIKEKVHVGMGPI